MGEKSPLVQASCGNMGRLSVLSRTVAAYGGRDTMRSKMTSLAALALIAACATHGRTVEREQPFTREAVGDDVIRIIVQNDNFMDARLYALGVTKRFPLGVVTGGQQAVLSVPWDYYEPLRIEIDLLAGPKCTTEEIDADPGDTFDLRIESVLLRSAACS